MSRRDPGNAPAASSGPGWTGVVVGLLAATLLWWLLRDDEPLPPDEVFPSQLVGRPLALDAAHGPRIFLLTEHRVRHWSYGYSSSSRLGVAADELQQHLTLWAIDAKSGRVMWRRVFVDNLPESMTSVGDYLGADAEALRLPLREPVRVAPDDGRLLPWTGAAATIAAAPTVHALVEVQARGQIADGRWIGLLTDEEFAKVHERAGEGWQPDRLGGLADARYALWTAAVRATGAARTDRPAGAPTEWGRTLHFSDYRRLGDDRFAAAGLLQLPGAAAPLAPGGAVLLLHRGSAPGADAATPATLLLSRVASDDARVLWHSALPQPVLRHVLDVGVGRLALVLESVPDRTLPPESRPATVQVLSIVDLADGARSDLRLDDAGIRAGAVMAE
jgi:hypothetical protein